MTMQKLSLLAESFVSFSSRQVALKFSLTRAQFDRCLSEEASPPQWEEIGLRLFGKPRTARDRARDRPRRSRSRSPHGDEAAPAAGPAAAADDGPGASGSDDKPRRGGHAKDQRPRRGVGVDNSTRAKTQSQVHEFYEGRDPPWDTKKLDVEGYAGEIVCAAAHEAARGGG